MFKAKITCGRLNEALKPVSILSDYCLIQFDESGLKIPVADESKSAQANVSLDSEAFDDFDVSDDSLGIRVDRLKKIVDDANQDSSIELEVNEDRNALLLTVEGQDYRLGLITEDSISTGPQELGLEHSAEIVVNKSEFDQAISAAEMFGDEVEELLFMVHEGDKSLVLKAEADTDMTKRELGQEELEEFDVGPAYSKFALHYMVDINKSVPKDTDIRIQLDRERPAKIVYSIADGDGEVTFHVAPRIQNN